MTGTPHIPTLEDAKSYIDSIDFTMIIKKIVKTKKWKKKDVEKIGELYRHFLFLKKKYDQMQDKLAPSLEIDEFWHTHILDTAKYRQDCEKIFGFYLDHYQYVGMDGKSTDKDAATAFEKTQALHHKEFGDYIYTVRHPVFNQFVNFVKMLFA